MNKITIVLFVSICFLTVSAGTSVWYYMNYQEYVEIHNSLKLDYNNLNSQYGNYIAVHTHSNSEYDAFQTQLAEYETTTKFTFYYASQSIQRYGVDDLEEYLDRWQWLEGAYVEGEYDCSEMSASLEWKLENEGYNTLIVVGKAPFNQSSNHAWLLVETSEDKYMPIEPTSFKLVKWDSPYFDLYFEYDQGFETIFEAIEDHYEEFNWWES